MASRCGVPPPTTSFAGEPVRDQSPLWSSRARVKLRVRARGRQAEDEGCSKERLRLCGACGQHAAHGGARTSPCRRRASRRSCSSGTRRRRCERASRAAPGTGTGPPWRAQRPEVLAASRDGEDAVAAGGIMDQSSSIAIDMSSHAAMRRQTPGHCQHRQVAGGMVHLQNGRHLLIRVRGAKNGQAGPEKRPQA